MTSNVKNVPESSTGRGPTCPFHVPKLRTRKLSIGYQELSEVGEMAVE